MTTRLWILGAADPEMEAIEALLRECGEQVAYATADGHRVTGGTAYRAGPVPEATHWVECESPSQACEVVIDHHRPGDPGYGRPPAEFLPASSIGQVIAALGALFGSESGPLGQWSQARLQEFPESGHLTYSQEEWYVGVRGYGTGSGMGDGLGTGYSRWATIPEILVHIAAADHCLSAAYRGECPGVDADELMRWRVETRAAFQGRSSSEVLADVGRARKALRAAPIEILGAEIDCRDVRGQHVPELPEASAREGLCFVADGLPDRDGRVKICCQSGSPDQIRAFLDSWAPAHGLIDTYGDPARGFAGGYLP